MTEHDDRLEAELHDYYARSGGQPAPDLTGRVMIAIDRRARRLRLWGAAAGGSLAAVVAAVVVLALVNHGASPPGSGPAHTPSPGPSVSPVPRTLPAVSPPPVAVAGPPVHGFVAGDVTAVSAAQWWVLGHDGPSCVSAGCTRLLHTIDGGATFTSVPPPPIAPARGGQTAGRVRFADPRDGWAVSPGGGVWATHDGGATWVADPTAGPARDLEAAGGSVYAIVCPLATSCEVERSSTSANGWAVLPGSTGHGGLTTLTLSGGHLWATISGGVTTLLASADAGQTFAVQDVCPGDLAISSISAVSSSVLWATCATGTEAAVFESIDGGAHFAIAGRPAGGIENSSSIAGVSSAIVVVGSGGSLWRSADGGRTYATVATSSTQWSVVGFTTPDNGFAFDSANTLWRTNDAGAHWYVVRFP